MNGSVDLSGATTIKDQGRRGTCVACAATAAHELVRGEDLEFSIEFLYWASKQSDGLPSGEEGTTLEAAKSALEFEGQPPEEVWPYSEDCDHLSDQYTPPQTAFDIAHARRLQGGSLHSPTIDAIRDAIDQGYPVVIGIRLFSTWHSVGPDGLIANPTPASRELGGHAVLVTGYLSGHLIIQNSWGVSWGKNGTALLENDYFEHYGLAAWSLGT